jgi:hypothetical protein
VTIQHPTQITSCPNLLAPVRQLSFNSRNSRLSFSQAKRLFTVEHCLASRSYLTCQNAFCYILLDSPVWNISTVSRLANCFRGTEGLRDRNRSHRPSVISDDSLNDIRQALLSSLRKSPSKLHLQSLLCYRRVHKAKKGFKT